MKNTNEFTVTEQVEVTLEDLTTGKYVFAKDVKISRMVGTGDKAKEHQVNTEFDFAGVGLLHVVESPALTTEVISIRRQYNDLGWYPISYTVRLVNGCKVDTDDLPPELVAEITLAKVRKAIPGSEAVKDAAMVAIKAAMLAEAKGNVAKQAAASKAVPVKS